ncbi:MAG: hypothetical protein ACRCVW_00190 [Brevinema sp.]
MHTPKQVKEIARSMSSIWFYQSYALSDPKLVMLQKALSFKKVL